ncbi:MAG: cation:proton antiporter [Saprospiraceae bacterium]
MASEVQIENVEQSKEEDPVSFSLTGEAGINDGLAFPFVFLAVLMANAKLDLTSWFLDKFLLKIIIGVAAGYVIGRFVGYSIERLPKIKGISNPHGFVSLSITFMAYGLTELIHGYGFLAVFVAALSIRYTEEVEGDIKVKMHDFVEEIEKLLLVVWVILFGGHLLNDVLSFASWKGALFAGIFILIVRPLAGWIGLLGSKINNRQRLIISFCGIRGIGSMFYLSWAFLQTEAFPESALLYSITAYVILFSIIIHGLVSPRVMGD